MPLDSKDIILHHYDMSPYAEKARLAFGIKGISWSSVEIPSMMPKPDLLPLTGGYRRTPVMQIGADIYCDTAMIFRTLEELFPHPTLFPGGRKGMPFALGTWADMSFFRATRPLVFAAIGAQLPEAFIQDREAMSGSSFRPEALKAFVPAAKDQWRACAGWVNDHLSDGKKWIMGEAPGLADINVFFCIWFVQERVPDLADELLAEFPETLRWTKEMRTIGVGRREEITAKEALEVARITDPIAQRQEDPHDPSGRKPGQTVLVAPNDYGKDPVEGEIISLSAQHITLRRIDENLGAIAVHFPRAGFTVKPA